MKKYNKIRLGALIVISVITMSMGLTVAPVSAYGTGSGGTDDPHDWITDQALVVLGADGYTTIRDEIQTSTYLAKIKQGSYDADHGSDILGIPVTASEHYHNPDSHLGLWLVIRFKSAATYAQENFEKAVKYYKNGDKANAYYYLGFALHVLQDLTVPHHAALTPFNQHSEYEAHIYNHKSYVTGVTSGGRYTLPNVADHYNDDSAWGWVDYNSHQSIGYYSYVNGGSDDNWDYVASMMLPLAVRTSAGFLRFFYEEANRGRQEAYRSSSLSGSGAEYTFYVDVPYGTHTVAMAGNEPDADFDLYVRWNAPPTTSTYDAKGFSSYALEKVQTTGKGRLYVMVRSWSGSGNFKASVIYGASRASLSTGSSLGSSGATVTNSLSGSLRNGFMHGWAFLAGPDTADFDLYIRWGAAPTTSTYDDRGFTAQSQEICDSWIDSSKTFYSMVRSYRGSGSYRLLLLIF